MGQEIYGCGAAFVFATRAFHCIEGAPFRLYCNQFVRAGARSADRALSITLDGGETSVADLSVVRMKRRRLPKTTLMTADGTVLSPKRRHPDRIDFEVPASGRLILTWD